MKRVRAKQAWWIWGFVLIFAGILFFSIVHQDGEMALLCKLGGILFCLFFVVAHYPHDYWLLTAMLTTCIADWFLASDNTSAAGVTVFLATQLLHLAHLHWAKLKWFIIVYAGVAGALLGLNVWLQLVPPLYLAAGFYAVVLLLNIVMAALWLHREPTEPRARAALLGFVLFACCDFCTGISYLSLSTVAVLPLFWYAPANVFVWLFYYPSQILLSNTGKCDIMLSKEGKLLEVYGR